MKEKHRFYPPGKIMHIINFHPEEREIESGGVNSDGMADDKKPELKIGIFLTPRSLYRKLRLTQTMISDHFMPVYRRQIDQLISELEKQEL
ncbi:hypothetical protein IFM89_010125 [Coptis chinensis]|uniref:Uncharacterized protein n=1 Tax=Coptis chinensis TaxID=261450 RepID=A0A835IBV3_9MAGN|nr:hypothetical protein IFM89_010125 [Coptis chinensis]